jgi:hypothetical protein
MIVWGYAPDLKFLRFHFRDKRLTWGHSPKVSMESLRLGEPCLTSGGEADRTKSLQLRCAHYM